MEGQKNPTPQKESRIRTMKSDIAEFLKETKPSLINIIAREVEEKKPVTFDKESSFLSRRLVFLGIVILIAATGGLGYIFLTQKGAEEKPIVKVPPPSPLFATEKSRTIILKSGEKTAIRQGLIDSAEEKEREGIIKRVLFKVQDRTGAEHFMTMEEFFHGLDIFPPGELLELLDKNFMATIYYQSDGPRFILTTKTSDPDRTESVMLNWEFTLQRDLFPLFLKEKTETKLAKFEDRSFRNIDWRYLKLDNVKDVGIAYTVFRARNYLIITFSKESLETAIGRLFLAN